MARKSKSSSQASSREPAGEIVTASSTGVGLSPRALARAIFDADNPEPFAHALPPQSLYLAVLEHGLSSSHDLIRLAHPEQIRAMLDFDLWSEDNFSEERFFEWIALVEEQDDFSVLHKVLGSLDLKLLAILIGSYVEVITFDEPNDQPPHPGFYTPDGGQTWLHLNIQETDRHFLFARFLALVFETSRELFYQVLSVPGVSTRSQLEEEAYSERNKRLESLGVPSVEWAHELLSPLPAKQLVSLVEKVQQDAVAVRTLPDVLPVALSRSSKREIQPLDAVFRAGLSGVEEEFTLLCNAALVITGATFSDYEGVKSQIEKILGAINLALERACLDASSVANAREVEQQSVEIVKKLGLQPFARTGLTLLEGIRRKATKLSQPVLEGLDPQSAEFLIIAGARERVPVIPEGLLVARDGSWQIEVIQGRMSPGVRAIVHVDELSAVERVIEQVGREKAVPRAT